MQIGIVGLPKVGKTTLFNTLTAAGATTDPYATSRGAHLAVARVPDPRLERLRDHFEPRRYTPATVQYVDVPGIAEGGGRESLDLAELRSVDALLHVVRAFEEPSLPHPAGSVDPRRDLESLDLELVLADLELVERRVDRLDRAAKSGLRPEDAHERRLLREALLPALESGFPLRGLTVEPGDARRLRGYGLLSAKPMLVAVNVGEDILREASPEEIGRPRGPAEETVVVSAPIEEEISRLPSEEQREFLADLGLEGPSLDRLIRASYRLLGRISFFTVGEDEVRAWTVGHGTRAREAAGTIHSDLERGFIRAEVVGWEDLLRLGSLPRCRQEGLLRLEGKDYELRDGEIVHFRFNV